LGTYITGTFLTDHVSANWLSILTSVSPIVATSFWFIFPAVNRWAQAGDFNAWDIGFSLGSLPIILIGMAFFRSSDRREEQHDEDEHIMTTEKPTELFW